MQGISRRVGGVLGTVLLAAAMVFAVGVARADQSRQATTLSQDQLWQRTIDLVAQGDFKGATDTIKQVQPRGELTEGVRAWLEEYEAKQATRREMDRADFDKYVEYAKARIERKEYRDALDWSLAAFNCAEDRESFLESGWLRDLVSDSLAAADEYRREHDWRKAYRIYSRLSALYEHEPRYQKLEHEVLTHLRLDVIFEDDGHWEERVERVRWRDAKQALELLERYYVEAVDFKRIAESGLEQLLLLADSKSAQEEFKGLGNEDDRNDFKLRIQEHLDQVRAAPSVDRTDCVRRFRRVVKEINTETVRLPEEMVVSELMRGALDPLDDFTTVIWPRDAQEFDKHTRGDFVGVGISIIKNRADEVEVVSPLEDTPAYRAGIQAGDIITEADGINLKGLSLNKVVDIITGDEGTEVVLTIRRNGKEIEFPLLRASVKIRSVKGVRRDPLDEERWDHWLDRELGIGYIRIISFQRNTVEDVDNALSELAGLKGLVLDLRGNPGGLLDAAWLLSSRFLKRGDTVVRTKARIKSENQTFEAPGTGPYSDLPLVVLVDERSASASEIVSGAVRDNGRGTVVGERTFGKFSVQNLIPLSRSGAKLKITTARYYLPNGDSLHRDPLAKTWGVQPDVPIRLVHKESMNVYRLWRDANLLGPPKTEDEKPAGDSAEDAAKTDEPDADGDTKGGADAKDEGAAKSGDDQEPAADDEEPDEDKLPPLEQPDENDRPKEDPQLGTAILLLRVTLIGESHPTLATAEMETIPGAARP
ncbi:MAG: S41 family peptidase [Phycisphaerae bacterium]